jgi:hypothetical protein
MPRPGILARARAFGESRVVCGVHNASAVEAGSMTDTAVFAVNRLHPHFGGTWRQPEPSSLHFERTPQGGRLLARTKPHYVRSASISIVGCPGNVVLFGMPMHKGSFPRQL